MIRDLAKKLATFSEYKSFVIIEATFQRGTFEAGVEILKNHATMALLRARSSEAELLIKMIRPRREIKPALGSRVQSSEKIWRIFTAQEIFSFVEEIGDRNQIHQLKPPIVPTLLVLETICAAVQKNFVKLKFKNFVTAGEPLSLHVVENRLEIKSAGVRKILGELS